MNNAQQEAEERYPLRKTKTLYHEQDVIARERASFIEGWECRERQGWVKVTDGLPKKGMRCIVYGEQIGVASIIYWVNYRMEWVNAICDLPSQANFISHWQPLPTPPEN